MEWSEFLEEEFKQEYMKELSMFLKSELKAGHIVYPHMSMIFSAFNVTQFNDVKIVILGQDPYHGEGQAHGLAFSVLKGCAVPPSLSNIYKELQDDLGLKIPSRCYSRWSNKR